MHYLAQVSLATLTASVIEVYNPETFAWEKQITDHGGERYVAHFSSGQANISGPLMTGNPNLPWMEIQCTDIAVMDELGASEWALMRDELRKPGHLRGSYKVSIANPANDRKVIRNQAGAAIGVTPNFSICGTNLTASFLAGDDPDESQEITGLE